MRNVVVVLAVGTLLSGCPTALEQEYPDARRIRRDANSDVGGGVDANTDANIDAFVGPDAGMDAFIGPDANTDAGMDAFVDPDAYVVPDAFVLPDAYVIPDAYIVPDAYVIPDAFVVPDAYVRPDAFVVPDAYVRPDAFVVPDAFVRPDAYVVPDAFIPRDAFAIPVCGNGTIERGEQCDDGNAIPGDGCTACRAPAVAFRLNSFLLRDPHVVTTVAPFGCRDMTDMTLLGYSVNDDSNGNLVADRNDDGILDLSIATVFRPLNQADGSSTTLELQFPACTTPAATTSCTTRGTVTTTLAMTRATGTCLEPVVGTVVHNYTPVIETPEGSCYVSNVIPTFNVALSGITIPLRDTRIAATYVGDAATGTVQGLLYGFVTEAYAMTANVPASVPGLGGRPLSTLFPGGAGNCAMHSDVDIYEGVRGWWVYINFTAPRVPWSD